MKAMASILILVLFAGCRVPHPNLINPVEFEVCKNGRQCQAALKRLPVGDKKVEYSFILLSQEKVRARCYMRITTKDETISLIWEGRLYAIDAKRISPTEEECKALLK